LGSVWLQGKFSLDLEFLNITLKYPLLITVKAIVVSKLFFNFIFNKNKFFVFKVIGVKESTLLNKLFTALNIVVIVFIFVCGVIKSDLSNWEIKPTVILFFSLI
jgi:hypothetical protein